MTSQDTLRIRQGSPDATYCDLLVQGQGLDEFEGKLAMFWTGGAPFSRVASMETRVTDGKFSLSLPQVHEKGSYKAKYVLFDVDGDGQCSPGDRYWQDFSAVGACTPTILAVDSNAPVFHLFTADASFCRRTVNICRAYDATGGKRPFLDLLIKGTGFDAYEGLYVWVTTRQGASSALLGTGHAAPITNGRFTLPLPNGYERQAAQEIVWFVDADRDGSCSAAGGDRFGTFTTGRFDPTGNETFEVTISDQQAAAAKTDACPILSSFLTMGVTGSGFAPHDVAVISLVIRTAANGATLRAAKTRLSSGAAMFSQIGWAYERGSNQEVLWYVDVDSDGVCDTAAGDHVGALMTDAFDPAGNEVFNLAITDNHVDRAARSEDICAVMNGCR